MLAWASPQSRGRRSSKPVRRQASSRAASSTSRLREPEFRDGRDVIAKNLELLADVAAVPSAYDAEALVSVLVGYLIQAGIPEPGDTTLVCCEFTYADGSKPHAVWAVLDAAWHGVPACLMLADDLPEARSRLADNAKIAGGTHSPDCDEKSGVNREVHAPFCGNPELIK